MGSSGLGAFNDIILPGLPEHGGVVAATSERLVGKKRPKEKSGKNREKSKSKRGKQAGLQLTPGAEGLMLATLLI